MVAKKAIDSPKGWRGRGTEGKKAREERRGMGRRCGSTGRKYEMEGAAEVRLAGSEALNDEVEVTEHGGREREAKAS